MPEKPSIHPDRRPAEKPIIPDPPNDGFPLDEDVSIPPPDSDAKTGVHKESDS